MLPNEGRYRERSYGRDYASSQWDQGRHNDWRGERDYGARDYGTRDHGRDARGDYRQDRDFLDRAGDEVRSWFGDEEAAHRREMDARRQREQDGHYREWRAGRIAELDRDYDEYRREHAQRFHNEFSSWRTERQGQRDSLSRVNEHMDVVGSDGEHVGTVDKIRGDRIILTKGDADAGGHHHSIPSRWIRSVDDKVTLAKTAEEARNHWRDEERSGAMGWNRDEDAQGRILNRSFPGTY
ncbi:MAG: DUF2171 domain-containing protein [Sphingomonas sp.]|nr:DUF2171 domain-containing protein [Sphingomonas sp.]